MCIRDRPLGIGLTSDGEYLDIELTEPIDSKEAVARMNAVSVEGIEMVSMVQISEEKKASGMTTVSYTHLVCKRTWIR